MHDDNDHFYQSNRVDTLVTLAVGSVLAIFAFAIVLILIEFVSGSIHGTFRSLATVFELLRSCYFCLVLRLGCNSVIRSALIVFSRCSCFQIGVFLLEC